MRRFLLILLAVVSLAACGEAGSAEEIDVTSDDVQVLTKEVDGVTYTCLFLYVDGYNAGAAVMHCVDDSEEDEAPR